MTLKDAIEKESWSPDSNLGMKIHDTRGPIINVTAVGECHTRTLSRLLQNGQDLLNATENKKQETEHLRFGSTCIYSKTPRLFTAVAVFTRYHLI